MINYTLTSKLKPEFQQVTVVVEDVKMGKQSYVRSIAGFQSTQKHLMKYWENLQSIKHL